MEAAVNAHLIHCHHHVFALFFVFISFVALSAFRLANSIWLTNSCFLFHLSLVSTTIDGTMKYIHKEDAKNNTHQLIRSPHLARMHSPKFGLRMLGLCSPFSVDVTHCVTVVVNEMKWNEIKYIFWWRKKKLFGWIQKCAIKNSIWKKKLFFKFGSFSFARRGFLTWAANASALRVRLLYRCVRHLYLFTKLSLCVLQYYTDTASQRARARKKSLPKIHTKGTEMNTRFANRNKNNNNKWENGGRIAKSVSKFKQSQYSALHRPIHDWYKTNW